MLVEVPPEMRWRLQPLFAGQPGLRGLVAAVLSGAMGQAYADDITNPHLALLHLWFYVVGGEARPESVEELLGALPATASLVVPDDWHAPLQRRCADNLTPHYRVGFGGAEWDRALLQSFIDALPADFKLRRIDADNFERFMQFEPDLVSNYKALDHFLERGLGFGIEHEGAFVSGCASFASGGGKLEIEIDTHHDFQRRGLATACAAALITHCLDNRIEPCWDAHSPVSAKLAGKLGFTHPAQYTSYYVHRVPV